MPPPSRPRTLRPRLTKIISKIGPYFSLYFLDTISIFGIKWLLEALLMRLVNTRVHDVLVITALHKRYQDLGGEKADAWHLVARSLGTYPSYVSEVLRGKRLPSPQFVLKLGLRRVIDYERIEG
jgi:hypothetical protein